MLRQRKKKVVFFVLTLLMTLMFRVYQPVSVMEAAPPPQGVAINESNFPDLNFEMYVKSNFDTGDRILDANEILVAQDINYAYLPDKIANLKGVEHFTQLQNLNVSDNLLTSVNLSQNTQLQGLWVANNRLTALDLTNNNQLQFLACYANHLTAINLWNRNFYSLMLGGQKYLTPLQASFVNNSYQFDLSAIPGVNIANIEFVTEQDIYDPLYNGQDPDADNLPLGANYDAASGILTVDPNILQDPAVNLPKIVYWYKSGGNFAPILQAPNPGNQPKGLPAAPVDPPRDSTLMDVTVSLNYVVNPPPADKLETISFDPSGGRWQDDTSGVKTLKAKAGDQISIIEAPVRDGYKFSHWEGSHYQPGDPFVVPAGGHIFTAIWQKILTLAPEAAQAASPVETLAVSVPAEATKPVATAADAVQALPKTGDLSGSCQGLGLILIAAGGLLLTIRKR